MAVYTVVTAEALTTLLARYDVGKLVSAKGIAEGVENTNYMVDTSGKDGAGNRFILTLYEKRVDEAELPFFLSLLDHLADRDLPVPRAIRDRDGVHLQTVAGRPACLIEFLPGFSLSLPTAAQAHAAGAALGELHHAVADFSGQRPNAMGLSGWCDLAAQCGDDLDMISPGLRARIDTELVWLDTHWPHDLTASVIHADLFPDNVLMRGDNVGGIIDFYFACTEVRAWDVAITHAAWSFDAEGRSYSAAVGDALIAGYDATHGLTVDERAAFPILARGACLRFLLTRAWDWLNTPPGALVTKKDPLAFLRRLDHYTAL